MRTTALALAGAFLAGLAAVAPAAAPAALAAVPTNPRVAIIVGATHGTTPTYRSYADQVYAEAIKYTPNVVRVYSPNATWSKVKAAVNGASIVVYFGHGNGWPSPYTYDPNYTTKDGFGLNYDLNGDGKLSDYENKYYGEPSIDDLTPAPNAVVLLFHLCYASGNSEPGDTAPSLSVARQRVDNYASAFLKAGARAVIADGHSHSPYYIWALFSTKQTIDQLWRGASNFHDHVLAYPSSRSAGFTYQLDPDNPSSGYYRSLTGKLSLRTEDVTGASYARTDLDPTTFVVPGAASARADGAPVYASAESAVAGTDPVATLQLDTRVRLDSKDATLAPDGSPVFAVHAIDGSLSGYMTGSALVPRDSQGPRTWIVDDGTGAFSPNGDGSQDSYPLSVRLSEPVAWTLGIVDGDGNTLATKSGSGSDTAAMTWSGLVGGSAVPDGVYRWTLHATDGWGNPALDDDGTLRVDTEAPTVSLPVAAADAVTTFSPNGDGYRDTVGFAAASDEAGTLLATVRNPSNSAVAHLAVGASTTGATLAWDGRNDAGSVVADATYGFQIAARDLAGNVSAPVTRAVAVYGSLGYAKSSKTVFFPQDGDTLAPATTFSFTLKSAATVTWTIVGPTGAVVRTVKTGVALAAGTYAWSWNGRNDAGAYVPRGTYRSVVTATNGSEGSGVAASVVADAFKVTLSDTTPARRQRVTVTATTAEGLKSAPRVTIFQPGIGSFTVTMTKSSSTVYKATITLKSSGTGTMRVRVAGYDTNGRAQGSSIYLPLH